jgi:hypothetical protein
MAFDAYMVLSDWQLKANYDAWLFDIRYQGQQLAVQERGRGYVDPSAYPYPPYTPPPPPPPPPPPSSNSPTNHFGTNQTSLGDSDDESLVLDSTADVKIVRQRK